MQLCLTLGTFGNTSRQMHNPPTQHTCMVLPADVSVEATLVSNSVHSTIWNTVMGAIFGALPGAARAGCCCWCWLMVMQRQVSAAVLPVRPRWAALAAVGQLQGRCRQRAELL